MATVIEQTTGARYHPGHVWKLLRRRGWRLQRPAPRAVERDERAIARWVAEDWPWICRNARRRWSVIVFWDESGASLLPVTRRSWAPCGNTPVVRHQFNGKRCSMAAAICYGSHGGGAEVAFHHQHGAYDTDTLIGALESYAASWAGRRRPWYGTGCPPTAAWRWPPGCASSGPGW